MTLGTCWLLCVSPRCKCERLPASLAMLGWPFRLFKGDMPLRGIQGLRGFSDCRCRHGLLLLLLLLTLLLRLQWATGGAAITTSASLLSRMPRAERVFTQCSPDCFEFLNPLCTSVFAKSSVFYSRQQYSVCDVLVWRSEGVHQTATQQRCHDCHRCWPRH